jgi:hypothetical protein
MSGIDCCTNHVQAYLATMNGLCWIFNATSLSQKTLGVYQGVRIDFRASFFVLLKQLQFYFQISRTNFEPAQHPGIDVYLLPSHYSPLRMATEIRSATSTRLRTKVGTALRLRKKVTFKKF